MVSHRQADLQTDGMSFLLFKALRQGFGLTPPGMNALRMI
jgi:hypothetical protein